MILLVHGYEGSGPGHWQRWLAAELTQRQIPHAFPDLPDASAPDCNTWVEVLERQVAAAPSPVTLVAHSLGCWAVDHLVARRGTTGLEAVLLVAPPSPFLWIDAVASFLPPPQDAAAWAPLAAASRLVGSDNDDYTSEEEFREIAARLGMPFEFLPGAGHINVDSGHGPWPWVLRWLGLA